jgi:hypothetical protein
MSTTVIVENEDGWSKRYHGYNVDWVDWDFGTLRLEKHTEDTVEVKKIDLSDDVSCVKEYDLENNRHIVWTNSKCDYAVSINVEKVEI